MIAALTVGVFVWGLIFWCIIRYRKRGDELPVQTRFNMPIEFLYTITPFLIVSVLFYYTAVVQTDVNRMSKNPDLRSRSSRSSGTGSSTTGTGRARTATPSPPPSARRRTSRCWSCRSASGSASRSTRRDVIHSFWVPELLFKRDVFPGDKANVFEVTIEQPGRVRGPVR